MPTLKAAIPQFVPGCEVYRNAISLYSGTYQVLGILCPPVAGRWPRGLGCEASFLSIPVRSLVATAVIVTLPESMKV